MTIENDTKAEIMELEFRISDLVDAVYDGLTDGYVTRKIAAKVFMEVVQAAKPAHMARAWTGLIAIAPVEHLADISLKSMPFFHGNDNPSEPVINAAHNVPAVEAQAAKAESSLMASIASPTATAKRGSKRSNEVRRSENHTTSAPQATRHARRTRRHSKSKVRA